MAWASIGKPVKEAQGKVSLWIPAEHWDCFGLCGTNGEELIPEIRASRNCTLTDFDSREWTGTSCSGGHWLFPQGGLRSGEPPEEGCPGGWYRTRFAQSFRAYRRREGISNPKLTAETPDLIFEALEYYESQEAAARVAYTRATV